MDKLNKHPLSFSFQKVNFEFKTDGKNLENLEVMYSDGTLTIPKPTKSESSISKYIRKNIFPHLTYLADYPESLKFETLLRIFGNKIHLYSDIIQEISFERPFEINPVSIRNDQPILNKTDIAPDGSGLFSTLANLKEFEPEKFDELVDDFNLIAPNELGIEIEDNPIEDLYLRITVNQLENPNASLPIQLLSDGQLKWFSMVSAILLSEKNLLIDEPENFMDTSMQSEFSNYLRNKIEKMQKCCIVTTHCETLVNTIKPSEVLMVDNDTDLVRVRRINEIDRLKKNMYSSGFPLGWYYHTGSLELYCDINEKNNQ